MWLQDGHSTSHFLPSRNVGREMEAGWIQLPTQSWFYTLHCLELLSSSNSLWRKQRAKCRWTDQNPVEEQGEQIAARDSSRIIPLLMTVHSRAEGFLEVQMPNKSSKRTLRCHILCGMKAQIAPAPFQDRAHVCSAIQPSPWGLQVETPSLTVCWACS